jgi:glycosyltransferase involved in cell wall biosynthesis
MRVLSVHSYYQERGGEDAVAEAECQLLRANGHTVETLIANNKTLEETPRLKAARDTLWSRDWYRKMTGVLGSQAFDLVHVHNFFPVISPSIFYACSDAKVPVVQTLHNFRLICPVATLWRDGETCHSCVGKAIAWPGVIHKCYRHSAAATATISAMLAWHGLLQTWDKKISLYIALTQFARVQFVEGGLPASKIMVKPNFIEPDPGQSDSEREGILYVGRLVPEKGISTLIHACTRLPGIRLTIAGDGPIRDELHGLVRSLSLSERVTFVGRLDPDDVKNRMGQAQLLVFPSEWYEGFPVTLAESFACGTPVVASRLGSMAEIVEPNQTGWLFRPGDAEDLANTISAGLADKTKLLKMSAACRLSFEHRYAADRNYAALMEIYSRALS